MWETSAQGRHQMTPDNKPLILQGEQIPEMPDFMIVVLPKDAASVRKEVKQFGDVMWGIPTQCVVREYKVFLASVLKANTPHSLS